MERNEFGREREWTKSITSRRCSDPYENKKQVYAPKRSPVEPLFYPDTLITQRFLRGWVRTVSGQQKSRKAEKQKAESDDCAVKFEAEADVR